MWVQSLGQEGPLEEGMAIHSSILAWRILMDREAWHATVHRFTKSWTRLKRLSSSSRQEYWSGLPCPPPGDLPDPEIKSTSLTSVAMAGGFFLPVGPPGKLPTYCLPNLRALSLEKAMAPHSSTVAWKIPWMEEPGRLQSMGSLRVRHG